VQQLALPQRLHRARPIWRADRVPEPPVARAPVRRGLPGILQQGCVSARRGLTAASASDLQAHALGRGRAAKRGDARRPPAKLVGPGGAKLRQLATERRERTEFQTAAAHGDMTLPGVRARRGSMTQQVDDVASRDAYGSSHGAATVARPRRRRWVLVAARRGWQAPRRSPGRARSEPERAPAACSIGLADDDLVHRAALYGHARRHSAAELTKTA